MRMTIRTLALSVGLLAGISLVPAGANAAQVKIGIILPYSGPDSSLGVMLDRGMELYRKTHPEVPGGHTLEVVKRDTTGPRADVALRLTQELIARERVSLIGGIVYSNNALAIMDITRQAKIPVLVMNAGEASITTKSPYVARVSFTMWQAAYPMGQYAFDKMNIKTAAVAYANYAPGKDSRDGFVAAFTKAGGKIVGDTPFPFPAMPDFTPFLQRVKDLKPDALYAFVPGGKWSTNLMKTFGALGMDKAGIKLIGPGDLTQDSELPNMGDVPLGVITIHHYSAAGDRPENKAFVAAWKKVYGDDSTPDFLAVQGWDGMAAIYHAVEKSNGKLTADSFVKAMDGWNFASPRGPIMIDPETRDIVDNQYVRRVEKHGGKLVNVEIDTIPMVKDPWKALNVK